MNERVETLIRKNVDNYAGYLGMMDAKDFEDLLRTFAKELLDVSTDTWKGPVEHGIDVMSSLVGFDILKQTRSRKYVEARGIVAHYFSYERGLKDWQIAEAMKRDRTTILHAINNTEFVMHHSYFLRDEPVRALYKEFKSIMEHE